MDSQNERIKVLNLLENGKISSDEAAKILLVLGETDCCEGLEERIKILDLLGAAQISVEEAMKLFYAVCRDNYEFDNESKERLKELSQDVKNFANNFSNRVNSFFAGAKPKVKHITKKVVSTTANLAGNISQGLHNTANKLEEKECCGCCDTKKAQDDDDSAVS